MKPYNCIALLFCLVALTGLSHAADFNVDSITDGKTISGPALTAKDYHNKVLLVVYWSPHCAPCLAEMPALERLYKSYAAKGLHIVAMEIENCSEAEIQTTLKGKNYTFQVTSGARIKDAHGHGIPHSYLFGADGSLVGENVSNLLLEDKIQSLLTGVKPANQAATAKK